MPTFEKDDIAITIHSGCIIPIKITDKTIAKDGTWYSFDYNEYLDFMKKTVNINNIELLEKDDKFLETDLFKSIEEFNEIVKDIKTIMQILEEA